MLDFGICGGVVCCGVVLVVVLVWEKGVFFVVVVFCYFVIGVWIVGFDVCWVGDYFSVVGFEDVNFFFGNFVGGCVD